jgi:hypothetical protein
MASSYTTNKAIEKPGYNDYINSWNVPVNSDMDIVDACFAGTYSIALTSSNVTLTQANCQVMRVRLTGALSANVTIFFPSGISGFFVVQNATSNAYTVTLASVGGGTSVLSGQSQSTAIFTDGTNVFYADDTRLQLTAGTGISISAGTSPTISLTIPVAVVNGGTGAITAPAALTSLGALPLAGGTMTGALIGTSASFVTTNSSATLSITDTGTSGVGIAMYGNGSTNPNKYIRTYNGSLEIVNSAYTAAILTVDNSGNLTAAGNVTAYSDAKIKKNVVTIRDALDKVKAMRGVFYTNINTDVDGMGVIAQEVLKVCPQAVQDNNGMLSVAYGNLVGVLIEAVKELSGKVAALESK